METVKVLFEITNLCTAIATAMLSRTTAAAAAAMAAVGKEASVNREKVYKRQLKMWSVSDVSEAKLTEVDVEDEIGLWSL